MAWGGNVVAVITLPVIVVVRRASAVLGYGGKTVMPAVQGPAIGITAPPYLRPI